jgi:DNA-binding transcriptional LysR family regulator
MDLQRLRYFCSVAEAANLRQAAETLRVTPGALSRAIRALESELGAEVFIRASNRLELTPAGKLIYERCRGILAEYEGLTQSLLRREGFPPPLRLATYCVFTTYFLDSLIGLSLSGLRIHQQRIPPGELEEAIRNRATDVGITFLPFPRGDLDCLPLAEFKMRVFARPRSFDRLPIEEIPFVASVSEVSGAPYSVQTMDGWPHLNVSRNLVYQVAGLDAALGIARRGLAAVYCPTFTAALHNQVVKRELRLAPVALPRPLGEQVYTAYLIKRKSDREEPPVKKLTSAIRRLTRAGEAPPLARS